jgi:PAS domain S-box-containing protein
MWHRAEREIGRREEALLRYQSARRAIAGPGLQSVLVRMLVVAAAYYVAARLSLELALVEENVTPLWPPTGIALVAFLTLGRGVWPGVALAAFLVNAPISTSPLAAAATAAGNTLAPLTAALLLQRVGFRPEIDRLRDAAAIVFLAALASMLISASVGAAALVLSDAIAPGDFLSAGAVWWAGDAMGVLVVAPFLLSLRLFRPGSRVSWTRRAEAAGLFVLLTIVTGVVVRTDLRILFVVLPFLGWAAWRFQLRGAAPAALLVATMATWAAAKGYGPFANGTLLEKMTTLQAFNATVAFTSFVFAAVVSERMRAREALEQAAAELEARVRRRTSELSTANEQLGREIAERTETERALREREAQLAEAQHVARVGSWEWAIPENRVTWSDEMYRIHGYRPQEFPVTFDRAIEQVVSEDLSRISRNVAAALEKRRDHDLPDIEYRILRRDGAERVLLGRGRFQVGPGGEPLRMVGTVQDVTEGKQAEREHRIAETLQRSLLPDRLPQIPGVLLAARYVPASTDMQVGGDWYDVLHLPDGQVGLVIGDVAGHGLRAASTMAQLRMALRSSALEELSPAAVVRRVHRLLERLAPSEIATLIYVVLDPDSGMIRFANAGHPPPLVILESGEASYLEQGLAPPLGATRLSDGYVEAVSPFPPGSTILLYTDGLVERRGASIRDGLARLKTEASAAASDLDSLCDHLLVSLAGGDVSDDIALLALRLVPLATQPLLIRVPAEPHVLALVRQTLRRWLREVAADPQEAYDILVACGEACANAIQHAYGAKEGFVELGVALEGGEVQVTVRDSGSWRSRATTDGGRGLQLMRGLMDAVEVDRGQGGTVVSMRRRLRVGAAP